MFFRATEEVLWRRIQERSAGWQKEESEGVGGGDPKFKVPRELLKSYLRGFEVPNNEGAIVVTVE